MGGARLKIVLPGGDGPDAVRRKFYVGSALAHVTILLVYVFVPQLFSFGRRPAFSDEFANAFHATLTADVGNEPIRATPAPAPKKEESKPVVQPPKPEPEPPPETGGDVEYDKRKKPEVKKEARPPDPEPVEDVVEGDDLDAPAGDASARVGDASSGVQAGGEISLFGWYQNSVSRALYGSWRRPVLAGQREALSVLVRFEIQRDGSIVNLAIAESSGVAALDRSALRAVADASPLPHLPPGWRQPRMTAVYQFELNPDGY